MYQLKQFNVLTNKEGHIKLIKVGFSWLAFWFTLIWALFNKQWQPLTIGIIIGIFIFFVKENTSLNENIIGESLLFAVTISINIIFGLKGNEWSKKQLLKDNYKIIGSVNAEFIGDAMKKASKLTSDKNT